MQAIVGHELVGHRLVGNMPRTELVAMWLKITTGIVKYGFTIEYRDLEPPRTGIFNGLAITLDPDIDFEMQCFILLHLFGHSVQWVSPEICPKLDDLRNTPDKALFLKVLREYEFEASQFGLQLLHEAELRDLDQWYADFVETDWQYVKRYYETGHIPPWNEGVASAWPPIEAKKIPRLEHKKVQVRFAF